MSVAVRIASVLGLNVDLVRAIALGHDIGHVPFGHEGENFLATRFKKDFNHAKFGAMLAQKVERKGVGLNLTYQTLCGIRDHSRGKGPLTATKDMSQEAVVVMHADKIAYITSDYNDMIHRLRLPSQWVESVSSDMQKLGSDQRSRVRNLIIALCEDSAGLGFVGFSDSEAGKIFTDIKAKMYKLYPLVNVHGHTSGLMRVGDYLEDVLREKAPLFFALMTDEDVLSLMDKNHFDITDLERTSVWEQIESVLNVFADITDPCLDW
jgi:dGTP triphosphohydrolase